MSAKKNDGGMFACPKGEVVWTQYHDSKGSVIYAMTTKGVSMHSADRNMYYLYGRDADGWKKLGRGKNPVELEEKYVRLK